MDSAMGDRTSAALRRCVFVLAWIVVGFLGATLFGQQPPAISLKRANGQAVVPVFEGWESNKDGTISMVFGYMNRNYAQTFSVPVGAENRFEPGDADRGQPTFFYTRRQEFVFRVTVPKDWGEKELVWTINVNGQPERAFGSLKPVWELSRAVRVDNLHGNVNINFADQDQPPSLTLDPVEQKVPAGSTLTLNAVVADADGIPPPPKPRPRGTAVGRTDDENGGPPFINVPFAPAWRFPPGLSAGWFVYRGPASATFEPEGYHTVQPGAKFETKARFNQPGTYVLRAIASDSMLETTSDVTVRVEAASR
jgi:hypothetical protein